MPIVISGTNGISGVDGTASNPSYEGTDANTGVFFPAADTVAIGTGGSERVRVDSSGTLKTNVGGVEGIQLATDLNNSAISSRLLFSETGSTLALFNSSGNLFFNTGASKGSSSGTTRVVFNANGVGLGGSTPSSGTGIAFPATQSASSDANTLDDYEEGTFTPTLNSGFSVAPTSYTTQLGRYTKVGRMVYFEIDINPNGATANSTQIRFSGLPFTSASAPYGCVVVGYNESFNTNAGDVYIIGDNSVRIDVNTNTAAVRDGNSAGININNRFIVSGVYTAA